MRLAHRTPDLPNDLIIQPNRTSICSITYDGIFNHPLSRQKKCEGLQTVLGWSDLQLTSSQIREAVTEDNFEKFLAEVAIPRDCSATKLPKFTIQSYSSPGEGVDSARWIRKNLVETMKTKTPVVFSFCLKEGCSDHQAHAVLIHGARLNCCSASSGTSCDYEYYIRELRQSARKCACGSLGKKCVRRAKSYGV